MLTILYRFVGGFMALKSTAITRLIFSAIMAICLSFAMLVKGNGYDVLSIVFVTSFFTTYAGRWIPHGWTWAIKAPWGYIWMSLIGFVRVALWMAPAFYFEPGLTPLCLFGLLQGAMYAIGRNFLDGVDSGIYYCEGAEVSQAGTIDAMRISVFAKGWTEWGEVLTGEFCYTLPYILFLAL